MHHPLFFCAALGEAVVDSQLLTGFNVQHTILKNTDLTVSRLCFGCWGISSDFHWGERDASKSAATINAAFEAGVNFFDTAAVYGDGESERLLGKTLGTRRSEVIIASKVRPDHMSPSDLVRGCEETLLRLGTDYLDLYQTHWANPDVPIEDSWAALLRLKEQGKVRFAGVCNAGPKDLTSLLPVEKPATNQLPYNLIWRAIEHAIVPACDAHKIGILAYSPLMHGMLAGKFPTAADVPDGRARSRHFSTNRELARHGEPGCEQATFDAITAIGEIANQSNRSMANVAANWVLQQAAVDCVIVGAASPQQIKANCDAFDAPLSDDELAALNSATDELKSVLGSNPDMWQGSEGSRYR